MHGGPLEGSFLSRNADRRQWFEQVWKHDPQLK